MIETELLQSYFTSSLLVFRQFAGRFGEQVIQKAAVSVIQMLRYLSEQILKVIIWFQVVCFSGTIVDSRFPLYIA